MDGGGVAGGARAGQGGGWRARTQVMGERRGGSGRGWWRGLIGAVDLGSRGGVGWDGDHLRRVRRDQLGASGSRSWRPDWYGARRGARRRIRSGGVVGGRASAVIVSWGAAVTDNMLFQGLIIGACARRAAGDGGARRGARPPGRGWAHRARCWARVGGNVGVFGIGDGAPSDGRREHGGWRAEPSVLCGGSRSRRRWRRCSRCCWRARTRCWRGSGTSAASGSRASCWRATFARRCSSRWAS